MNTILVLPLFLSVMASQAKQQITDSGTNGAASAQVTTDSGNAASPAFTMKTSGRDTLVLSILRDEASGWSASDWITLTSTLIALVAVVIGPLSAYHIANKQIVATVVSSNRQVWINELRGHLAELDAAFFEIAAAHEPNATIVEKVSAWRSAVFLRAKIRLLLNPAEEDHKELLRLAGLAYGETSEPVDADKLNAARDLMMVKAGEVLKREWERVKSAK